MNVSFTSKKTWLLGLVLCFCHWAKAQNYDPPVSLSVLQNQSVSYGYVHIGHPSQTFILNSTNQHGQFSGPIQSGPSYNRAVIYNAFSVGTDTCYLRLNKPPYGLPTIRMIVVTVLPSYLNAKDDYTLTAIDQPITIPVTANDTSNRGVINITKIAINYNGSASIQNNEILFTPNPGFEGLANLNYVVCDDIGNCDFATAHICVGDPYAYADDTILLHTIKNTPIPVLTPLAGYTLSSAPQNGSLTPVDGILHYQPNLAFHGIDQAVYTHNTSGVTKTLKIDVFNKNAKNLYLNDDVAYTLLDEPIEVNVFDNDLYGFWLNNLQITAPPSNGTLTNLGQGLFLYTPTNGFEGVDEFEYSASPNSNGSNAERAKAYIIVSDLKPGAAVFNLRTPVNTPLVINYNIPIPDFDFTIVTQANSGIVRYYPGNLDTIINGQHIQGYNLLIYYPNQGVFGLDEFEVKYIIPGSNNLPLTKVKVDIQNITPSPGADFCIDSDCVWAGDANLDGKVDLRDLLPIGLYSSQVGKPRPYATVSPWYGQTAPDWGEKLAGSSVDIKHIDTNGDSVITALDTFAINEFYQQTHSLSAEPVNFPSGIPLFLGSPDTIFVQGPGDIVEIPILLGEENQPAFDIYGLTFSIDFDPNTIDPESSKIVFEKNSWMSYNSPVLTMTKKPFSGRIDAGYTRTTGVSSSGYGRIGTVSFIIVDDLLPTRIPEASFSVRLSGGTGITSGGQEVSFAPSQVTLKIGTPKENNKIVSSEDLILFPNPASTFLNIKLNGVTLMEKIEIFDFSGRKVSENVNTTDRIGIPINHLENGLYVIRVKTETGVITKKFEVMRP